MGAFSVDCQHSIIIVIIIIIIFYNFIILQFLK